MTAGAHCLYFPFRPANSISCADDCAFDKGKADLAQSSKASLIAIEDRSGVNACKILRLPFTGALGILIRMREKDMVSEEEAVRKLETLQKFGRYRPDIIEDVKRRLEAKK